MALWLKHTAQLALCVLLTFAPSDALLAQTGKIVSITFQGSKRFSEAELTAVSGLHPGDSVGREEIQAAADRLAKLGLFTDVRFRFGSKGENVTVEFQLQDAPTVPVSFDNFPWFTDAELTRELREAAGLFDGTAPEQGAILDAMTQALENLLHSRGVNASVERTLLARLDADGMMQQFRVVGASLKVGTVEFQDALANEDKRVRERLSDLIGKPYSRYAIEVFDAEQVRPVYLERGYLRVRFGTPHARFSGDPSRPLPDNVLVNVPVEPGPAYQWAGAKWSANTLLTSEALDGFLGLKAGEPANGLKIATGWERVRSEYGRLGYLDAKVVAVPVFHDAAGAVASVSYQVSVTEGLRYRMGEMVITGLSLEAERRLRDAWHLLPGQIFNRVYFEEFLETGVKQAFGDLPVHYNEIGRWLRTHPEAKTVDVLLDFH